ncbi:DUF47 family protein [Amycolatopsis acidicola]|uniref:DUF47 family protein n=1 Tax=Amycolatopsis acidicola TaxID=2596893 RepID=A0A5N0UL38_9PSEU|nr:DUF47 family protein [Amycolatopsis acidicola]KAA9150113.1 DUF47 family protein [Amycolatopsis acidicola]
MRLTPRDNRFFELLTQAATNLVTGAKLLSELVAAPPGERGPIAARMHEIENAGDDVTHEIMLTLNTSFITPFDRQDIGILAARLDDVLDEMDEAADLAVLYQIGDFPPGVEKLVELLCRAADLTAGAMPGLRKVTELAPFWREANSIEDEADGVYRRLLAYLFNNGADPLTVLKTKEVIDRLESAADSFEHVADVVQTIAVKES